LRSQPVKTAVTRASVILCTRNRADQLSEALDALGAMQVPPDVDWEVLVIDNGSGDATRETVQAFIANGHPRFRYVYEPEPGKTYALNLGIEEARGDILAFTDDDALVEANWLTAILASMEKHSADGVGGKVLPIWDAPRPAWLRDRFLNVLAILDLGDRAFALDWKNPPLMLFGVNVAFRRSVFVRLGLFNTVLGSRGEEQELFDRLAVHNARVVYEPSMIVRHHIAASRLTKEYYREWYRASGRARAKLDPGQVRTMCGIPLFSIRNAISTVGRFVMAGLSGQRDAALSEYLTLNLYATFFFDRLRLRASRDAIASPPRSVRLP
jgi:glucosyl-dolichyl phosphate glucuronosyltransferase